MTLSSSSLPFSLVSLDDWQLIRVDGFDAKKYLQGQITADMDKLSAENYLFAAHCDAKGKVWSNLILLQIAESYFYIERASVVEKQIAELKKYAMFSKVTIGVEQQLTMVGVAGENARTQLAAYFSQLPNENKPVVQQEGITLVLLPQPTERFILIGEPDVLNNITQQLTQNEINQAESEQWQALDIEAGYPIIDMPSTNEFLPQAINLQLINGISFDKGCYCGQEMVARAQFRGMNKRALFHLAGQSESFPNIGDGLELKLGENWRETGKILSVVRLDNGQLWVQAVLSNDTDETAQFRIKDDLMSSLTLVNQE